VYINNFSDSDLNSVANGASRKYPNLAIVVECDNHVTQVHPGSFPQKSLYNKSSCECDNHTTFNQTMNTDLQQ
jgi:hypothetical protein